MVTVSYSRYQGAICVLAPDMGAWDRFVWGDDWPRQGNAPHYQRITETHARDLLADLAAEMNGGRLSASATAFASELARALSDMEAHRREGPRPITWTLETPRRGEQ